MAEKRDEVNAWPIFVKAPVVDTAKKKLTTEQLGRVLAYSMDAVFGIPHNRRLVADMGKDELAIAESWADYVRDGAANVDA